MKKFQSFLKLINNFCFENLINSKNFSKYINFFLDNEKNK